jgi:glycerate 2-kinase
MPPDVSFKIITDVDNPLLGANGAAEVFGPQKGASSLQVGQLEEGMASWCRLLETMSGKSLARVEGAGAAGGIAVPLMAYFNAEIVPGAQYVLSMLNFHEQVKWADIVITGEGKIDSQTLSNKAPKAVADAARQEGKPVIAIGGTVEPAALTLFTGGAFSFLSKPVSLDEAMHNAKTYLSEFSSELAKNILALKKSNKTSSNFFQQ